MQNPILNFIKNLLRPNPNFFVSGFRTFPIHLISEKNYINFENVRIMSFLVTSFFCTILIMSQHLILKIL